MDFIDKDESDYIINILKNSSIVRIIGSIISEVGEDIKCLKYVFQHYGSVGGSTIRLARMIRMMYVTTFILMVVIIFFMEFDTQTSNVVIENVGK